MNIFRRFSHEERARKSRTRSISRTLRLANLSRFNENRTNSTFIIIFKVLRHANIVEVMCFVFGCFMAIANGLCSWPVVTYLMANYAQDMSIILDQDKRSARNISDSEDSKYFNFSTEKAWDSAISHFTYSAAISVIVTLVTGYLNMLIFAYTAERIIFRFKILYIKSLLNQDMNWFLTKSQGELLSAIIKSLDLMQISLGDKLGLFIMSASEIIASIIIMLMSGWQLTLAISALYPILIITSKLSIWFQRKIVIATLNDDLTGILQEVIASIRTVFAFCGEEMELKRFTDRSRIIRGRTMKQGVISGINFSIVFPIVQCFISLTAWYGSKLIRQKENLAFLGPKITYDVKHVIVIITLILFSAFLLRQVVHLSEILNLGFRAAADIISVIERDPQIDSSSTNGRTIEKLNGKIVFENVNFCFPSSDEIQVIRDLNLHIKTGETVALVGPSGGGKSTILQLIQRFYDPQEGEIRVDGIPLKEFSIGWFRSKIGVVNQEPHLFNTTIKENIKYGNEKASEEDIIRAAKEANAHDFILTLPQRYDTVVGEQGSLLSGGQKQRIAIARALVRNPPILLLDEATSALDTESEARVQESLDRAKSGRTVVIVAHRLNTIENADRIVAIENGTVVEEGTHEELIAKKGLYHHLIEIHWTHKPNDEEQLQKDVAGKPAKKMQGKIKETNNNVSFAKKIGEDSNLFTNKSDMHTYFWEMLKLCREDWIIIFCVFVFSILTACCLPTRGFAYANILYVIVDINSGYSSDFWSLMYFLTGVVILFFMSLKIFTQALAEENLLLRIRHLIMKAILKQEVGWFDEQDIGNLSSLVVMDAESVKKIPGAIIGSWVFICTTISINIVVSFFVQWKLALATSSASVGLIISFWMKEKLDRQMLIKRGAADTEANNLAMEAIRNYRTVVSLHIQTLICNKFTEVLGRTNGLANKMVHLRALAVALPDVFCLMGTAIAFSYGGYLTSNNEVSFIGFTTLSALLINNILEVSVVFSATPSCTKACISAKRIMDLLARKPMIDSSESAGIQLSPITKLRIEFRDVWFAYPTRPNDVILQNFHLVIENGENLAFIGESGKGKSTAMHLLQRFYDPIKGEVTINGCNIKSLNVKFLRSLTGIVSQPPKLFNRSIAENIAYGNNEREIDITEIMEAAKIADFHEFISDLSQGYDTLIGDRGVELSGGQKQRVAIARALVKNPKILLLDEATSALDNESEKAVQESLEKAQKGRTCITIAHRLSTIQNVGRIVVFSGDNVIEKNLSH